MKRCRRPVRLRRGTYCRPEAAAHLQTRTDWQRCTPPADSARGSAWGLVSGAALAERTLSPSPTLVRPWTPPRQPLRRRPLPLQRQQWRLARGSGWPSRSPWTLSHERPCLAAPARPQFAWPPRGGPPRPSPPAPGPPGPAPLPWRSPDPAGCPGCPRPGVRASSRGDRGASAAVACER
eukprot:scaffold1726_cov260-Pinguiococcus_pyrenoidosus.AAC.5